MSNFQNVKIFKFVRSTVNGLQWPASFFTTLGRSLTFTIYHFTLSIDLLPARKAILLLSKNIIFSFFLQTMKRDDQVPHDDTDSGEAGEEVGSCSYFQFRFSYFHFFYFQILILYKIILDFQFWFLFLNFKFFYFQLLVFSFLYLTF